MLLSLSCKCDIRRRTETDIDSTLRTLIVLSEFLLCTIKVCIANLYYFMFAYLSSKVRNMLYFVVCMLIIVFLLLVLIIYSNNGYVVQL